MVQWAWGRGVSNGAALFIVGLLAGDGEGWFGGRPRVSFRDDARTFRYIPPLSAAYIVLGNVEIVRSGRGVSGLAGAGAPCRPGAMLAGGRDFGDASSRRCAVR